MRLGVDTYSYHRLLGEVRPGEEPARIRWADPLGDVVAEARRIGADVLSLETSLLGPTSEVDPVLLAGAAESVEQVIAWGAPDGIRNGTDTEAFDDLVRWIGLAGVVGCRLVRIVLGGPALRGQLEFSRLVDSAAGMLATAADVAESVGVRLAVENHGDATTAQLLSAIRRADRPGVLGVCFDTANALRVGEDATAAARAVAELTLMVHLKDVAPFDPRPSVTGPCSVAYGTGTVPIDDVLAVLATAGFEGPVLVELGQLGPGVDECALVEECLDWLRVFTRSARTR